MRRLGHLDDQESDARMPVEIVPRGNDLDVRSGSDTHQRAGRRPLLTERATFSHPWLSRLHAAYAV
jgi:hypothetical protein